MTALNMMVQPKARAGYLLTDTAVSSYTGEVQRFAGKVVYGAGRFPWAAGVSGNVMPEMFFQEVAKAQPLTLKQLERRLPSMMRSAVRATAEAQGKVEGEFLLKVAGVAWDFAHRRPLGFMATSSAGVTIGQAIEPFTWYETDWTVATHHHPSELLGREVDVMDPASFDPETDGRDLVIAQRAAGMVSVTPGLNDAAAGIGGEVQMTVVTKAGVQVWGIHDFGDRVGERIAA